jgi:tRNA(His) guanylyltransferase
MDELPPLHQARKDPDLVLERTEYVALELPPLGKVINRVGVLLGGEEPKTAG